MNSTFKTVMYLVLGFMIVSLVATLFFAILPYMLLLGVILFAVFKIKGYFISKKRKTSSNSYTKTYSSNTKWEDKVDMKENIDDDVVDIIDVDYKEVK